MLRTVTPLAAGAEEVPEMSSAMTTRSGGGGGGDAHESKRYLLSFAGSELSCHLHHVGAKRAEAMGGMIALLYDRVEGILSRPYLARIFIGLGPGGRRRMRRRRIMTSVK